MKRLLTIVLLLLATVGLKAQVFRIGEFTLEATETTYGIYADYDCSEKNFIYIDMQGPQETPQIQMRLGDLEIEDLVSSIRKACVVYNEWSKIAHENGIKSVSKMIKTPFLKRDFYFLYEGLWFEERNVDMECKFMVSDDGTCYLIIQSEDITSEETVEFHNFSVDKPYGALIGRWSVGIDYFSNIKGYCSGASLAFSSTEEIEMFIAKLHQASAWKSKNIEQGKLFK